jgi:hypothetical protein
MSIYKLFQQFLFFYIWSTTFLERVIKQTQKTTKVIFNSFSDETLYFFPDSIVPLIVGNKNPVIISPDLESNCWSFHNNIFKFMNDDNNYSSKKLPYLSACLYKDNVFVADISEWIQNIEVISTQNLPSRFIVFAWAYQANIVLESYTTSSYFLEVITLDGDEIRLDVKTT